MCFYSTLDKIVSVLANSYTLSFREPLYFWSIKKEEDESKLERRNASCNYQIHRKR